MRLPAMFEILVRQWALMLVFGVQIIASSVPGAPENITVTFLSPSSVQVTWATMADGADKYDVMYKPTDARYYRVVTIVAGNVGGAALQGLLPGTQYQLVVTAVRGGRKLRSRPIVFRTMGKPTPPPRIVLHHRHHRYQGDLLFETPRTSPQQEALGGPLQVRGVEVGIVLVVLLVWVAAIALFFNRWGKIRMLLPYQPDYKEQLKAAAAASAPSCAPQPHVSGQPCAQHLHWSRLAGSRFDCSAGVSPGHVHRPRLNSVFAYAGTDHPPELYFPPVCRKALSAENLPTGNPQAVPIIKAPPSLEVLEQVQQNSNV